MENQDNFEMLRMMDEYHRRKNNQRSTNWRKAHPDKSAAIELRRAAKLAAQYPHLGFIVTEPLQYCDEYDLERARNLFDQKLHDNAVNGVYGGAAK